MCLRGGVFNVNPRTLVSGLEEDKLCRNEGVGGIMVMHCGAAWVGSR